MNFLRHSNGGPESQKRGIDGNCISPYKLRRLRVGSVANSYAIMISNLKMSALN